MKSRDYALIVCWIAGLALSPLIERLWPLGLAGLLAASWYARRQGRRVVVCMLLCLAGLGWARLREPRAGDADPVRLAPLEQAVISGRVAGDWSEQGPQRWSFDLDAEALVSHQRRQHLAGRLRVSLRLPAGSHLSSVPAIGDRIQLSGRLALPQPALNFGAFSYRDYLRRQGIFSLFYARQLTPQSDAPAVVWLPARWLQTLRRELLKGFETHLPQGQARLLGSLLVGAGASPVPNSIQQRFQAAGLQHVLAVSGFQVELVVLSVMALCQLLRLSRGRTFGMSLGALWLFVALTGFPGSVLRAAAVASLGLLGYLKFRSLDALAGLSIGCSVLLLAMPWLLSDIGFQFSVLATLGLMLSASALEARLDWLPLPLSKALAPMLAAQLWILPAQDGRPFCTKCPADCGAVRTPVGCAV